MQEHLIRIIPGFCNREKVIDRADAYQKQLHDFVDEIQRVNPEVTYEDAFKTFVLIKLAVLSDEVGMAVRASMNDSLQ